MRKDQKGSGWGVVGLFIALGLVMLATIAGVSLPNDSHVSGEAGS
jgi:hypothetical protein